MTKCNQLLIRGEGNVYCQMKFQVALNLYGESSLCKAREWQLLLNNQIHQVSGENTETFVALHMGH